MLVATKVGTEVRRFVELKLSGATDSLPGRCELGVPSSHLKVINIDTEDDLVLFVVEQALPTKHLLETCLLQDTFVASFPEKSSTGMSVEAAQQAA